MRIVLAKKEDLKKLEKIIFETWGEDTKKSFVKEFNSMFINSPIKQNFVVAKQNNEIIGVGSFSQSFINFYAYEISWICVSISHRSSGVGRKIVQNIIDRIKKLTGDNKALYIMLTAKNNEHLNSFYGKLGFKAIHSYIDTAGKDANLMILDL